MADRETFKENLPYYMDLAGMNQIDLAKAVRKSKSTVSTWLSGRSYPRIDTIQMIADTLGCDTDDLVTNTDRIKPISNDERILFRLARKAKPEAIRAAVAVLKSMEETNDEF